MPKAFLHSSCESSHPAISDSDDHGQSCDSLSESMLKLGKQDLQDFKIYGILIAESNFCIHLVNPHILQILILTTNGSQPFFVRIRIFKISRFSGI